MTIVAIYAVKGGVGKTSAAVNLAYEFSSRNRKTLLIDLDAQGASGYYLKSRADRNFSGKSLLDRKGDLRPHIKASDYEYLDVLPSKSSFRNLDIDLERGKDQSNRLRKSFRHLKDDYDILLLDCPPTMTLLAENIFHAADLIFIPIVPTPLSLRTMDQVLAFFEKDKLDRNKIYAFFSMVEKRKNMHRTTMEYIALHYERILETTVPRSADVEKMGIQCKPVQCFAPQNSSGKAFSQLGEEILTILDNQ